MTTRHAIVWLDHQQAQVLQFDAENVHPHKLHAHSHPTGQHGSAVRSEHEFFGAVCDALQGIAEVLAVGPHTGIADFEHYVRKHRPALAPHIVAYQVVDHPTERQLVAQGRAFFLAHDRMTRVPTPS